VDETEFLTVQLAFAQRLVRLANSPTRGGAFAVDAELAAVEGAVNGSENVSTVLAPPLPATDPRIRERMAQVGHVLADLPSAALFGAPEPSVLQRRRRYELVAALACSSGLPDSLLDGDRHAGCRFDTSSEYFHSRCVPTLNEQYITVWCRRLLAPYQLTIMDLFAKGGRTTEQLLHQHLGGGGITLADLGLE
jgi:hypothetical protein